MATTKVTTDLIADATITAAKLASTTGSGAVVLAASPVLTTPALGTPSALVGTNITGTAAAFNINGTVGATTPAAGVFTTVKATAAVDFNAASVNTSGVGANKASYYSAAGNSVFSGTTSWEVRNQADSASLLHVTNAGVVTIAGTLAAGATAVTGTLSSSGRVLATGFMNSTNVSGALVDATTVTVYANNAAAIAIDSSQRVGIGTTSPGAQLHVKAAAAINGIIILDAASTYSAYTRYDSAAVAKAYVGRGTISGSDDLELYSVTSQNIRFYSGGTTERLRIDSSGNLLVGATSAFSFGKQCIFFDPAINAGIAFKPTSDVGPTPLIFTNASGTAVGSVATTVSATAYNTSSDYRLKNTIAPMTGALAKVAALKPVTYKWKVDGSDGQGFIAHELQEVVEGCVTGEKDATREEEYEVTPAVPAVVDAEGVETTPAVQAVKGTRTVPSYQGIDTSFLVATLTAAIQELKAIIDTQAAQITALNAKVGI